MRYENKSDKLMGSYKVEREFEIKIDWDKTVIFEEKDIIILGKILNPDDVCVKISLTCNDFEKNYSFSDLDYLYELINLGAIVKEKEEIKDGNKQDFYKGWDISIVWASWRAKKPEASWFSCNDEDYFYTNLEDGSKRFGFETIEELKKAIDNKQENDTGMICTDGPK